MAVDKHIVAYHGTVTRARREILLAQRSKVFWFTGLSGAGKSTIAHGLEERLFTEGRLTYVFDGDNVRHGLCRDLGFSPEDRRENLRRIGEMLRLFIDSGIICMAAFVSPLREDRAVVREIVGEENFIEIFVKCPLSVCETRDVKGLYKLAKAGVIKNYTGVSAPYEHPERPDIIIETDNSDINYCVSRVYTFVKESCFLKME